MPDRVLVHRVGGHARILADPHAPTTGASGLEWAGVGPSSYIESNIQSIQRRGSYFDGEAIDGIAVPADH